MGCDGFFNLSSLEAVIAIHFFYRGSSVGLQGPSKVQGFQKMKSVCDQERLPEAEDFSVWRRRDRIMVSYRKPCG